MKLAFHAVLMARAPSAYMRLALDVGGSGGGRGGGSIGLVLCSNDSIGKGAKLE